MSQGLDLDHVTVIRGDTRILSSISARIPAGRCTAVIGASGAGKSSLLRLLNRLDDPSTGQVLLDDVPLTEFDVLALRRRIVLVGQQPVLLADHVDRDLRVGNPQLGDDDIQTLLERVGLPATFAHRRTGELSGGEAQRVCLARALAVQPEVLLLDEPTSALDGVSSAAIIETSREHLATGGTVVLVSHDLGVVRGIADTVLVLDHGHLVAKGHPGELDHLEAWS